MKTYDEQEIFTERPAVHTKRSLRIYYPHAFAFARIERGGHVSLKGFVSKCIFKSVCHTNRFTTLYFHILSHLSPQTSMYFNEI